MPAQTIFAPAKLNLFLAITGRRADGFHDLLSVVAPLDLGDELRVSEEPTSRTPRFSLRCDDPAVPVDESNLVLRAAQVFAAETGWSGAAHFDLLKRTPVGAGLGGGSSDATATLRALNQLAGNLVGLDTLARLAATLGSDCPLFLQEGPVVMRGRGERIEPLPPSAAKRLKGKRVLVFKPAFGISTAWAYRHLAEPSAQTESTYIPAAVAERRVADWIADPDATVDALLFNTLERVAFGKFVALPTLLERLRVEFGLKPMMTGSGSACFAFLPDDAPLEQLTTTIRQAWGDSAFIVTAKIA
ncbi:MAG TPA: 4-(cytidine 5'-diphospho)-2-C-methyl-D-erythritol kinase [Opitutaceae bacterium]|nr:4-(cytidine 5'-diphospho)-2-C-methyl-D-erythritol kinase [Opitutaceae bacterium]